jgi:molybdopterin synthase catalytic subunit
MVGANRNYGSWQWPPQANVIMIQLTHAPIDEAALIRLVRSAEAGAIVLFLGTTREFTQGKQTAALKYDAYAAMAEKKLGELEAEARAKWPLVGCAIVHRLGEVPLAETSVAIAVSSPHRAAAFEAGKWLIDTLKEVVPIWKEEQYADGTTEWVHPGVNR